MEAWVSQIVTAIIGIVIPIVVITIDKKRTRAVDRKEIADADRADVEAVKLKRKLVRGEQADLYWFVRMFFRQSEVIRDLFGILEQIFEKHININGSAKQQMEDCKEVWKVLEDKVQDRLDNNN